MHPHPMERLMKKKLRVAVNTYLEFKEKFDAEDDPSAEMRDKERLLRGIVRGQAMIIQTFVDPPNHKDKKKIEHMEWLCGFPHKSHRLPPPPPKSPTMVAHLVKHGMIE